MRLPECALTAYSFAGSGYLTSSFRGIPTVKKSRKLKRSLSERLNFIDRSNHSGSLSHYVPLHAAELVEKLFLLRRANLEFVKSFHQVFDQRIEIRIGDTHALVSGFHVFAGILAGSAGGGADLGDERGFELRKPIRILHRVGEKPVYPRVGAHVVNKLINYGCDSLSSVQPGVERFLRRILRGRDAHASG